MLFQGLLVIYNLLAHIPSSICLISETVTVKEYGSQLLQNCCQLGYTNWKFGEVYLFYRSGKIDDDIFPNVTLRNKSLSLDLVTLDNEGYYGCFCGDKLKANYTLVVEVIPSVYITIGGRHVHDEYFMEEGGNLTAECHAVRAKPPVNVTWTVGEDIRDRARISGTSSPHPSGKNTFNAVSTLFVPHVERDGDLSCTKSPQIVSEESTLHLAYRTYALPHLFMSINGQKLEDFKYAEEEQELWIQCKAVDAKPSADLELFSAGTVTYSDDTITTKSTTSNAAVRFTTVLNASVVVSSFSAQTIACRSTLRGVCLHQSINGSFLTFVSPTVVLTVNDSSADIILLEKGKDVLVVCKAIGGRPEPNITLSLNNVIIPESRIILRETTKTSLSSKTYDTTVMFSFTPDIESGIISCSFQFQPFNVKSKYVSFKAKGMDKRIIQLQLWMISIPATLLLLVATTTMAVLRLKRGFRNRRYERTITSRTSSLRQSYCQHETLRREGSECQHSTLRREASPEDETSPSLNENMLDMEEIPCEDRLVGSRRGSSKLFHRPPSLKLPEVPTVCAVTRDYEAVPDKENPYYSELKEKATQGRMFYAKDMCLVFNMKVGNLYSRWTGTIPASNNQTKNVVITTATETALKDHGIHWNDFVKRMLELPKNRNVPLIEGICIDTVVLYLVQEHCICESLESYVDAIWADVEDDEAVTYLNESKRHIYDILEGIELIQSYGFLHPGLSLKKVLLTNHGVCKLYDFCLAEDATNVVLAKKSSIEVTFNTFPPEAVQRNEYTRGSDVWSMGVLIWQLFSSGSLPFTTYGQTDGEWTLRNNCKTEYQSFCVECLTGCWNTDVCQRPPIHQLRTMFSNALQALIEDQSASECNTCSVVDLYVPMKPVAAGENYCAADKAEDVLRGPKLHI